MALRALSIVDSTVDRKCMLHVIDSQGLDILYVSIALEKFRHSDSEIRITMV